MDGTAGSHLLSVAAAGSSGCRAVPTRAAFETDTLQAIVGSRAPNMATIRVHSIACGRYVDVCFAFYTAHADARQE